MKPRKKTCRICQTKFMPNTTTQVVCSPNCAIEHARHKGEKRERRMWRERKRALRSKSDLAKDAQQAFNRFIRLRDQNLPCISCGRYHKGQYHAGHYRTTKAAPELRFEELNCHSQCAPCNNHLSGNIVEYRINLINRIGLDKVEWLESKHEPKHYTREQLIDIKKHYQDKCKLIK